MRFLARTVKETQLVRLRSVCLCLFVWLLFPAMYPRIEDADFSAKKIWLAG